MRPTQLFGKGRKKHREGPGVKSLCGRLNCDMYSKVTLPDNKVTCPECLALLERRKAA